MPGVREFVFPQSDRSQHLQAIAGGFLLAVRQRPVGGQRRGAHGGGLHHGMHQVAVAYHRVDGMGDLADAGHWRQAADGEGLAVDVEDHVGHWL